MSSLAAATKQNPFSWHETALESRDASSGQKLHEAPEKTYAPAPSEAMHSDALAHDSDCNCCDMSNWCSTAPGAQLPSRYVYVAPPAVMARHHAADTHETNKSPFPVRSATLEPSDQLPFW